ncbi:MAG TPA: hypothetical protein VMV50_01660 [Candidatus Paceibacterota bacterium]|nr:hypothetical protein [Candidatus Paceibacterota bacterium]
MKSAILLSLSLMLGACAAIEAPQTPPPGVRLVEEPDVRPGDWWIERNGGSVWKVTVTSVDGDLVRTTVGDPFGLMKPHTVVFRKGGALVEGPGGLMGRATHWTNWYPSYEPLSFPLWAGKEWSGWVTWTATGISGSYHVSAIAGPWQSWYVGERKFDALKITYRLDRLEAAPVTDTCWYVPAAKWLGSCDRYWTWDDYRVTAFGGN